MEEMKKWMETEGLRYSESFLTGKAVTYAYTRWEEMMRILDDGQLLLDNNLAENEHPARNARTEKLYVLR